MFRKYKLTTIPFKQYIGHLKYLSSTIAKDFLSLSIVKQNIVNNIEFISPKRNIIISNITKNYFNINSLLL